MPRILHQLMLINVQTATFIKRVETQGDTVKPMLIEHNLYKNGEM